MRWLLATVDSAALQSESWNMSNATLFASNFGLS